MAEKVGAIVKKGNSEECIKMAMSLLEEFGFPVGLLPVKDVIEAGFVRETGYFWIVQKKRVDHTFKLIDGHVRYETEISGYMGNKSMKKLKGVKTRNLMIWTSIQEMSVDDDQVSPQSAAATATATAANSRKLTVKGVAGVTMSFPVEAFALGQ